MPILICQSCFKKIEDKGFVEIEGKIYCKTCKPPYRTEPEKPILERLIEAMLKPRPKELPPFEKVLDEIATEIIKRLPFGR